MKTIGLTVAGAVLAALTSTTLLGETVEVPQGPYQYSDAGELNAVGSPETYLSGYASVAQVAGGFETFAADSDLPVYYNQAYNFTLSQTDVAGHALTQGAALLYYDFSQGDLPNYDYSTLPTAYNRITDAGLLQTAIWAFQGYANPGTQYPNGTNANPFYQYALSTDANALSPNDGLFDVSIMQLSNDDGPAQNLLVAQFPSVPDSGTTAVLLTGACGLLMAARRRMGTEATR